VTAEQLASLLAGEPASAGGLSRRLALGLRHLIAGDVLASGTRLPPERELAKAVHVSRPTVTAALDELRALGLLESRRGSGTWVAERAARRSPVPAMADVVLTGRGINLAAANPQDATHLGALRLDLGDLLAATPAHGVDPVGLPALRERLATRHGVRADDVIVTHGAQHALALVLGAFCRPGDRVVCEEHTYGGLLDLLDVARAQPVPVRRDAHGTDPDALERALRGSRPRLVYLTPSIHAPTGAATTAERRAELARVLDRHEATVIVDETLADLRCGPRPPAFPAARTIAVESLSKSVWGGLRIGWIRAPGALREALLHQRARTDLGTSVPAQLLALALMERFDALLATRNAELREKAALLQQALTERLPDWPVELPDGGLCLWIRLPLDDAAGYVRAAGRAGVVVMPGTVARADRGPDPHIRVCFDRSPHLLEEAAVRMASASPR
jgi:DNA-binding transcriptional MocR family regulator